MTPIEITITKDKKKKTIKFSDITTAKTITDIYTKKGWKIIKTQLLFNIK